MFRTVHKGRPVGRPQLENVDSLKKEIDIDDHRISPQDLANRYKTDLTKGLSSDQAELFYQRDGPNSLTPAKTTPWYWILLKHQFAGFSLLLWIGAFLCFLGYSINYFSGGDEVKDNLYLAAALIMVCVITGIFSFMQEAKSSRIIDSFTKMVPAKAHVIRDGKHRTVLTSQLVRGDLVVLKAGDRVPADIRLTRAYGLKVDLSSLTGEAEPKRRHARVAVAQSILEAGNMVFFSTNVVEGFAYGIVILCGDNTVMGRIAGLTMRLEQVDTPIAKEITRFMHIISSWACLLGFSFFVMSLLLGYRWLDAVLFLIGIIVANVPEGLLATVTVCLSLTAKRMAAKNCVVKYLEAVETLGSTSTICSDKTGTLTQNRMTVTHLSYNQLVVEVDYQLDPTGLSDEVRDDPVLQSLVRVGCLCSRAEFVDGQEEVPVLKRDVRGDASETAILKFCALALEVYGVAKVREQYKKVFEIPFNSSDKFQLSIHETPSGGHLLVLKGAPERVLDRCSTVLQSSGVNKLSSQMRRYYEERIEELGGYGERVIGFCELQISPQTFPLGFAFSASKQNFPSTNLCFIGLVSMLDPPRPGVLDAVNKCRTAGIRVIMVTGDHPVTAKTIAKAVGIISEKSETVEDIAKRKGVPVSSVEPTEATAIVVPGQGLRDMSSEQLELILRKHREIIFARTSPTQKLLIVEACQKLGEIVAVTGDGVNDSPALKKADIGIAMGITGSDVSKQTADMILLDDNFASIITGIEEGRLIFDNLKKSVAYVMASNVAEITPFLIYVSLGVPLPLGVITILCIDLGTDMWPAIALAHEKAESDIMLRKPRNLAKDRLVTGKLLFVACAQIGMMEALSGFFTYFVIMGENGWRPSDLVGARAQWDNKAINDMADSYGQEWTYQQRKKLEYTAQTAFFVALVVVQVASVMAFKTRYNSIVQVGISNWMLNCGLLFELALACAISYLPGMDSVLKTYPVRGRWWLPAIPWAVAILVYDEGRKWWLRRHPGGWIERNTYY